MRSVTKQSVREARLKEIKQELLNSEKLKVSGGYSPSDLDCKRRWWKHFVSGHFCFDSDIF